MLIDLAVVSMMFLCMDGEIATYPAKKAQTANVEYTATFALELVSVSICPPPPSPLSALNSPIHQRKVLAGSMRRKMMRDTRTHKADEAEHIDLWNIKLCTER